MKTIDWENLDFSIRETDANIRCVFKDGKWGEFEFHTSVNVSINMGATCLHYGQSVFEGLKAYRGADGEVRLFRPEANGERLADSAKRILLQDLPVEKFVEAVNLVVEKNKASIPPYGTGATLYIRPFMLGTAPLLGVKPSPETSFIIFVSPVGPYFKEGITPVDICIERRYDRAATRGTGSIKMGGNYAAGLLPTGDAAAKGFSSALFLDPSEQKYLDECGPANIFGIKGNTYVTPKSTSILPSITNDSLMTLAEDLGMKVEQRRIPVEELSDFDEVGACGTAAIISPIRKIVDKEKGVDYCYGDEIGGKSKALYDKLTGIQFGTEPDPHNWTTVLPV